MSRMLGRTRAVSPDLLERIASHARQQPTRIAVSQGSYSLDYVTLWQRIEQMAHVLRVRGVQAGDLIGVHAARTPELLVVLLALWRVEAAWVPLDPAFPQERVRTMCADADLRLVITASPAAWLPESVSQCALASLLTSADAVQCDPGHGAPLAADALAYVMYTSGSTGRPKGVEVTHGALANLLHAMRDEPGLTAHDVLLAVTTLSFDIAMLELWGPLLVGGRVEIALESEQMAPERLAERLEQCGATVMQATPVTWRMLLASGWSGRLRSIWCGGEPFPPELVAPLLERAEQLWNLYGPTETTVWSTVERVSTPPRGARVSIGVPIANTRVYVMTGDGLPAPVGEAGELWIAGDGVARGYRHNPTLTAAAFVPEPCAEGGRAYRTGDLARIAEDGALEHLGRIDQQIKLHGYRIEPAEIEGALVALAGVRQAVVALGGPADDPRLVAYVVPDSAQPDRLSPSMLRRTLRGTLPVYMVPAMIVELEQLPLTPNGKIDRRALPDPFTRVSEAEATQQPQNDRERALARVWCDVLGLERVGRHDNFFELGGHSLLALRVVERVRRDVGITLDVRVLFFHSLAQVAAGDA